MPEEITTNQISSETLSEGTAQTAEQMAAELERTRTALKAANREAAERRKRLEDLEQAEAKRKEAEMTELQRLQKQAVDAEAARDAAIQNANATLIRAAFIAEAAKLGALHPDDAYALADKTGVTLADGLVTGAAEAVKALIEAKRLPVGSQLQAPNLNAGAGGGQRPDAVPQATPEEVAEARKLGIKIEDYMKAKRPKE